ncbi:1-deoxy-D-xylulose-5-phosphate synthase [Dubosiella muris]|uniref:1-deoxy-D-xylulose-5-phosphate synthase n=1 Tax=Dubosiella muris TaxID=3038133 RepID=A0AC61R9P9_9FIRM|nr:1-deoxy-D-xylulose-5-phosphate synthase [Dubosiella muris]TGY67012.1 1-deoxy-D-xylulose-5-phosphate synthase [Dubosiella muris]
MKITDIQSPDQIKSMSTKQLQELADDIRMFLIGSISRTGGHLSSNLGVVELTIALHYVFHSPNDKFLFDVGHQSYTHKILTGRAGAFSTLRKHNGLSGFQKRSESVHDAWEAGHSSTSLSAALGMAIARDLQHENFEIIPIIGDGALSGGMALEALNDIGVSHKKMIIIFNDNNMSISKNHGAIEKRLTNLRSSSLYRHMKQDVKTNLNQTKTGVNLLHSLTHLRDSLKDSLVDAPLFKEFNLDYLGPVDGHNIPALIKVLETAKEHEGPIVVHVITQKGKGYKLAEQDRTGKWHGVGPFDPATGRLLVKLPPQEISWSQVISNTLIDLAAKNPKIVAITPAMAQGSKLLEFASRYKDRFFDCGIAEQHAVTMAAGMAVGGLHPFVSIYSSFLQRAYDQINHDVARMNVPVVFGIDRAGLVGDDGETHQGIYDIAFLRSIPNLVLSQPKDAKEAQNLLYSAFAYNGPFCIRYPRGNVHYAPNERYEAIEIGTWTCHIVGIPEQIVITYGPDVDRLIQKARENAMGVMVINARFFKPIDTKMLDTVFKENLPVTVFETDCEIGSLSSAILEAMNKKDHQIDIIGIQDHFVPQGSIRVLRQEEGIDIDTVFERLERKNA